MSLLEEARRELIRRAADDLQALIHGKERGLAA